MSRVFGTIPQELLLTSTEMARRLGVGVSTVKRWADEGKIESVRTEGGHRRFRLPKSETPFVATPADLDRVGDALRELGRKWQRGKIGIDEEHRQSHRIAEELARCRAIHAKGPLALLACPPGERHELPLHLVRLALEWRGWRTEMLGADLPWDALAHAIAKHKPRLVALSARAAIDARELAKIAKKIPVVVGGSWARGPGKGVLRFRSLRAFDRWLGSEDGGLDLF